MDRNRQKSPDQTAWMNILLIIINMLIFAAGTAAAGTGKDPGIWNRGGALYAPLIVTGRELYRLITSVFLHADLSHLFNNMVVLFAGGGIVERNMGHIRYGIFYLLCGIGGNIVSVVSDCISGQYGFSIGASGAVFGVIGALVCMILREYLGQRRDPDVPYRSRIIYQNLLVRAAVMTVFLLYSGWRNPVVNQAAHAGGIMVGYLLAIIFMSDRQPDLHELMN